MAQAPGTSSSTRSPQATANEPPHWDWSTEWLVLIQINSERPDESMPAEQMTKLRSSEQAPANAGISLPNGYFCWPPFHSKFPILRLSG